MNTTEINYSKVQGIPTIELSFCGKKIMAHLDTGSDQYLTISEADGKFCKFKKNSTIEGQGYTLNTIFGTKTETRKRVLLSQISLGNYIIEKVPTGISGKISALLGTGFLRDNNVVLDLINQKIYVRKANHSADSDSSFFTSSGIVIGWFDTTLKVVFVWNNSAADNYGISPGDIITSINNQNTQKIQLETWCQLKANLNNRKSLQVTIQKPETSSFKFFSLPIGDLRKRLAE